MVEPFLISAIVGSPATEDCLYASRKERRDQRCSKLRSGTFFSFFIVAKSQLIRMKDITLLFSSLCVVGSLAVLFLLSRKYDTTMSHYLFWLSSAQNGDREPSKKEESIDGIAQLLDFNVHDTEPRPHRPWSSGKFAMTMGIRSIRRLPEDDRFLLDKQYVEEQALRRKLLK